MRPVLAALIALLAAAPAAAQQGPTEGQAVAVMQRIERAWQTAVQQRQPLVRRCAYGTWAISRFAPDTTIRLDVRRSESLISPFVGVVEITGYLLTNSGSSRANGFLDQFSRPQQQRCFRTLDEAKVATSDADFGAMNVARPFRMVAEYRITPAGAEMGEVNVGFRNAILTDAMELPENSAAWAGVLRQSLGTTTPRRRQ